MNIPKKEKSCTENEAFMKIMAFCSYQERTQEEVRTKLYGYGLNKDTVEEIIVKLIQENFLNEERFAKAYAGGKFRIKSWGRRKILEGLKHKNISEYCIRQALKEISEDDYLETLKRLLEKRNEKEKEQNAFKRKSKLAIYLIGKGYEQEMVWDLLNNKIE